MLMGGVLSCKKLIVNIEMKNKEMVNSNNNTTMKNTNLTLALLLVSGFAFAQGIYNNGAHIVIGSGANVIIDGNTGHYRNETNSGDDAVIHLTGTLKLGGNFTNNVAASDAFGTLATGSEVVFAGTGTQTIGGASTAVFNFDKLTVNSGATAEVAAGKRVTAAGNTTVNGTLTLKDDGTGVATYLDNGTVGGSGTYKMEQYLTGSGGATPNGRRWFISSPVAGAVSASVAAAGNNRLQNWIEANDSYTEITDDVTGLSVTRGYVFRGEADGNVTFSGTAFNTGNLSASGLSYTLLADADERGFHIVGNPYPSVYDWEAAGLTDVSPSMTYRTTDGGGTMVYDTYNASSHLGTNNNGSGDVTQYIPPMQGFWVEVTDDAGGQIDFTNAGRSHGTSQLRSSSVHSLIRLNISNGNVSDQLIVNFDANAGQGFETYDSKKMFANVACELYAQVDGKNLIINSLPEITTETVVPLTIKIATAGNYTINTQEITGDLNDYTVQLLDNSTNTYTDLAQNPIYPFYAIAGTNSSRFSLVFAPTISTGIAAGKQAQSGIVLYNSNRQLIIELNDATTGQATIFDMAGRKVHTQFLPDAHNKFELPLDTGIYTVEVVSANRKSVKKIFIN